MPFKWLVLSFLGGGGVLVLTTTRFARGGLYFESLEKEGAGNGVVPLARLQRNIGNSARSGDAGNRCSSCARLLRDPRESFVRLLS